MVGLFRSWEFWVLLALPFVAYWPALRGEFVWDDLVLVKQNTLATGELTLRSIWFQADFPLSTIAFWLHGLLWGMDSTGYHLLNVALHAGNVVLLWRVLRRLGAGGAWLGAALFAVHPVCVASTAWISELKNTLSLGFCLLSFWCFLRFEDRPNAGSAATNRRWYWLALVAFVLSLLSKTSTVMLPVVMVLYCWWRRGSLKTVPWCQLSPFYAVSLAFGLMTIWFQKHQVIHGVAVEGGNFLQRMGIAGRALWFYLGKALLPVDLCLVYPRWDLVTPSVLTLLPVVLWVVALALPVLWERMERIGGRHIAFALGCFTVMVLPMLGFFDMYFMTLSRVSDHFQYPALLSITALTAAALWKWWPGRGFAVIGALLLAGCVGLSFQRARVFVTDEALWVDTLARNPTAWNAHNNLGCIRAEQGRLAEAVKHFEASLQFNPANGRAHVNLGRALAVQGNFPKAEEHFQAALRIRADDYEAHAQYGSALADAGRLEPAITHLREAVRLKSSVELRMQLAGLCRATGRMKEAIEHTRAVLEAKPDQIEAMSNLSWLLATSNDAALRDGPEAVRLAESACRRTAFKDARLVGTLAAAYAEAGDFTNAVSRAQEAVLLAQAGGNTRFAAMNQQLLLLYRAGKPFREDIRR